MYWYMLWQAQALKEIQRIFVFNKKKRRRNEKWGEKSMVVIGLSHCTLMYVVYSIRPFFVRFHLVFFSIVICRASISHRKKEKQKWEYGFTTESKTTRGYHDILYLGNTPSPFLSWLSVSVSATFCWMSIFFSSLCFLCIASALFSLKDFKRLRSSNRSFTLIIN